jgi:dihydrofolate reductase
VRKVNGGADVAGQFLNAGVLDEIRLHLVPVIMSQGTRLFDGVDPNLRLLPREARNGIAVTHLIYGLDSPAAHR